MAAITMAASPQRFDARREDDTGGLILTSPVRWARAAAAAAAAAEGGGQRQRRWAGGVGATAALAATRPAARAQPCSRLLTRLQGPGHMQDVHVLRSGERPLLLPAAVLLRHTLPLPCTTLLRCGVVQPCHSASRCKRACSQVGAAEAAVSAALRKTAAGRQWSVQARVRTVCCRACHRPHWAAALVHARTAGAAAALTHSAA